MPTETFIRLPEEKRTRFMNAAWAEFTHTPFADASINQIVRQAGIPRGSFYQYFTDKEDLFVYLMQDVQDRFAQSYIRLFLSTGRDLFKLQTVAFDNIFQHGTNKDPLMDRCMHILRINPGMDLQKMMDERPGHKLLKTMYGQIDATAFKRQDMEYLQQVFTLSIMALGSAVMDSLTNPDRSAEYRQELEQRLQIIQHGCLAADTTQFPTP